MPEILELCTYFDHRYLTRALAMYESLRAHGRPFRLWALCLTEECERVLNALALTDVVPISLQDLEREVPELAAVKADRSLVEYYFTCTSSLMSWLFACQPAIDALTYIDADLYFFADPHALLEELGDCATLIVPHRFSARNAVHLEFGNFNVGWITFRRDPDGLACLDWWRRVCLEWCHDFVDGDRFADQKYLDQFPSRFKRVHIAHHPGVNLAPWNLDRHHLTRDDRGRLLVDQAPLIFFHFHGLRQVSAHLWSTIHPSYGAPLGRNIRAWLYRPYIAELKKAEKRLRREIGAQGPMTRGIKSVVPTRLRLLRYVFSQGGGVISW